MSQRVYAAIDLKSFYASVECVERGLDPLTANLVVADPRRTEKTICLAVTPSLKKYGLSGRSRLFEVVEKAMAATRACGLEPSTVPIRGGTDGAQLSYRGLPCPNLPTGSYGHHGPFEHAVAEEMDDCAALLVQIAIEFAK